MTKSALFTPGSIVRRAFARLFPHGMGSLNASRDVFFFAMDDRRRFIPQRVWDRHSAFIVHQRLHHSRQGAVHSDNTSVFTMGPMAKLDL